MPTPVAAAGCPALQSTLRAGENFAILRGSSRPSNPERYWSVRERLDRGLVGLVKGRVATTLFFSPREADALLAELRVLYRSEPAITAVLERHFRTAIEQFNVRSQQLGDKHTRIATMDARVAAWATPTHLEALGFSFSFTPIKHLLSATDDAIPLKEQLQRFHGALISHMDEGIGMANDADLASLGVATFAEGHAKTVEALRSLNLPRVRTIFDYWKLQRELYLESRASVVKEFRRMNPSSPFNDQEIADTLLGPTLDAYYGHVFDLSVKSGLAADEALAAAITDGGWEIGHLKHGPRTLASSIRSILRDPNPEAAWKRAFPGVDFRKHEQELRRAALASDDVTMTRALPPDIRNRYLLRRKGETGWTPDWRLQAEVTSRSAARHIHFGPLFNEGGAMHSLIVDWGKLDPSGSAAFADGLARVAGVTPRRDAAFRDIAEYTYGLTGLVYHAIVLAWPGVALPNVLGLPVYALGEAARPGLKEGAHDVLAAIKTTTDSGFRNALDRLGMRSTYSRNPTIEGATEIGQRLWQAFDAQDPLLAMRYLKESALSFTDFISITETHVVKPFAYALGLARWQRENGLVGVPFSQLPEEALDDMLGAMMSTAAKLTVLPGASNVMPAMRVAHDIPVIGPLSTMFLSTPVNILGFTTRNLKTMLDHRALPADRAQAARVFGTTLFAGTAIAGPYWFFPWFREMESSEDREGLIGALNSFEKRFTLAGALQIDLARRLSPIAGVFERFYPVGAAGVGEAALRTTFGPLGPAASDILAGLFGSDLAARRRVLGAASEFMDIPAASVIPGAAQVLIPGATGLERILRSVMHDIPAVDERGFTLDPTGRATRPGPTEFGEVKAWLLGSRDLEDTLAAAEGVRFDKRVEHRSTVEKQMRAAILDGNAQRAIDLWSANQDLSPVITLNEVEREGLFRRLPAQARAIYTSPIRDALPRGQRAVERLAAGNLSPRERMSEQAILLAVVLKLRSGVRVPSDELLGSSLTLGPAPR